MFFYDILNVISNIKNRIRTTKLELKLIIQRRCCYFDFIAFVLLSYIFKSFEKEQVYSNLLTS